MSEDCPKQLVYIYNIIYTDTDYMYKITNILHYEYYSIKNRY